MPLFRFDPATPLVVTSGSATRCSSPLVGIDLAFGSSETLILCLHAAASAPRRRRFPRLRRIRVVSASRSNFYPSARVAGVFKTTTPLDVCLVTPTLWQCSLDVLPACHALRRRQPLFSFRNSSLVFKCSALPSWFNSLSFLSVCFYSPASSPFVGDGGGGGGGAPPHPPLSFSLLPPFLFFLTFFLFF